MYASVRIPKLLTAHVAGMKPVGEIDSIMAGPIKQKSTLQQLIKRYANLLIVSIFWLDHNLNFFQHYLGIATTIIVDC